MTYHMIRDQSNPDGERGHSERERMHRAQKKIDGKKLKYKFAGNKSRAARKIHRKPFNVASYADPKTRALPMTCPCYKRGCTYANCDGCAVIWNYRKQQERENERNENTI